MPLTLGDGVLGALRLAQTGRVLATSGLDWLRDGRPPAPRFLRQTCERLGATYIKLGQFVASSPSLFPAEYVTEFEACLDRTEPLPFRTVQRVMRRELGSLSKIYREIDARPLASASIAQVHAARLISGEDVVVKVQKPGVEAILNTDLTVLHTGSRVLETLAPGLSPGALSDLVEELQSAMADECDFRLEAAHLTEFRHFLEASDNEGAVAPKIYPRGSTRRVLTMERLYGASLTDLDAVRRVSDSPEQTLIHAMNTWAGSLMHCEVFHADVHAGNLLILDDGRVGFIDFGIVGRIRAETWLAMSALMNALSARDYHALAGAMIALGATGQQVDQARLAADLQTLGGKLKDLDAEHMEADTQRLLIELTEVGKRHGVRFPRAFTLLLKQFLYFDRYVRLLAPELQPWLDERVQLGKQPQP